jgi:hypothetical protein
MTYYGPRVVQKALRQAQLYGYLIARHGHLYYPGGTRPLCGVQLSKANRPIGIAARLHRQI